VKVPVTVATPPFTVATERSAFLRQQRLEIGDPFLAFTGGEQEQVTEGSVALHFFARELQGEFLGQLVFDADHVLEGLLERVLVGVVHGHLFFASFVPRSEFPVARRIAAHRRFWIEGLFMHVARKSTPPPRTLQERVGDRFVSDPG
jgi:hypothetical protein